MVESRGHRLRAVLLVALLAVALVAALTSAAASLGGLRTQHLGSATAVAHQVDDVTLTWTPQWHEDSWRAVELEVTAAQARGFLAGDTVRVTIGAVDSCELIMDVTSATTALTVDAARLTQACDTLPALDETTRVALAVTGVDGATVATNIGPLRGSIAGFDAPVVAAATAAATTDAGQVRSLAIEVPGARPSDLTGSRVSLAATTAAGVQTVTTVVSSAAAGDSGAVASVDVRDQSWSTATEVRIDAAISLPQVLAQGTGSGAGVVLAGTRIEAESRPAESAIDPVQTSPGLDYSRERPWQGAWPDQLSFTHQFTVTNTTDRPIQDWWITFDTTLAPMWGLDPTDSSVLQIFGGFETRSYDPSSGLWTIGGTSWASTLAPGESVTLGFNVVRVPTPEVDPSLFETTFRTAQQDDGRLQLTVEVTSTSEFYVPWQGELDLTEVVCAEALGDHSVSFDEGQVTASAVDGSSTRYLVGGSYNNVLVSALQPRTLVIGTFTPASSWQGDGCGDGS